MNFYEEETKYKKKAKKKSVKKSKHKHDYEKVLLKQNVSIGNQNYDNLMGGCRCKICGKIKVEKFWFSERTDDGMYRMLDNTEVLLLKENQGLEILEGNFI